MYFFKKFSILFFLLASLPTLSKADETAENKTSEELLVSAFKSICLVNPADKLISEEVINSATSAGFKINAKHNPAEFRAKGLITSRTNFQNASINICEVWQLSKFNSGDLIAIKEMLNKNFDSVKLNPNEITLEKFGDGQVFYKKFDNDQKIQIVALMPPRIKNGKPAWSDSLKIFSLILDKNPPEQNKNYAISKEDKDLADKIFDACIVQLVDGKPIDIKLLSSVYDVSKETKDFVSLYQKANSMKSQIVVNVKENNCQILLSETRVSAFPIANYIKLKMLFDERLQILAAYRNVLNNDELLGLDMYFVPKNKLANDALPNIFVRRNLFFQEIKVGYNLD